MTHPQRLAEGGLLAVCLLGWALLITLCVRAYRLVRLPRRHRGA
ncbi:hypothetical protein [Mumia sp. DW29H23]